MRLLNNVERAAQSTSTSLQHSEHSREQKKCWMDVEAKFKCFKLFHHRFNYVTTRFNLVEKGGQTLSTFPFSKIKRMLKQTLKPLTWALLCCIQKMLCLHHESCFQNNAHNSWSNKLDMTNMVLTAEYQTGFFCRSEVTGQRSLFYQFWNNPNP